MATAIEFTATAAHADLTDNDGGVGAPVPVDPLPTPVAPSGEVSSGTGSGAPVAAPDDAGGPLSEPATKKNKKNKKRGKESDDIRETGPHGHDVELQTAVGTFAIRGHVFMLGEYERRDAVVVTPRGTIESAKIDSVDLLLRDARLALHYHDPDDWLQVVVDLRVSDKPKMKNAFIQAKGHHLLARVGQFKMPVSAIEMESSWDLPTVRHGFLHELLVKRLDVAGRRPGVLFGWHGYGKVQPRLFAGAFQGSVVTSESAADRKTDFLRESSSRAQSFVARAEVDGPGVNVGAYYENRIGSPGTLTTDHYWTAGLDLTLDRPFEGGGVRVWADALAGGSWFELRDKPKDNKDATFVATRAVVALRLGGAEDRAYYLEPFALVGGLDPDVDVATDIAWEVGAGVNAGLWKRARLTLQGEINKAQRNFPEGYFVGPAPNRVAIMLQAGAAF